MTRPLLTAARYAADLTAGADAARPDADLLRRFAADGDGAAFAALVRRHGPMVWAACRQLLPNPADAEDAFQAVFLALVRSAERMKPGPLGGWLHGVAVRAAKQIRRAAVRRAAREAKAARPEANRPVPDSAWDELLAAVHAEIQRLPDGLRTAFVLCELEGVPQAAAAARLGVGPGTFTSRLTRARQRLLDRLAKRGFAPAALAGLAAASAGAAVPPALAGRVLALAAAPGGATAAVSQLVREVTAMAWSKAKLTAAALLAAGGLGVSAGGGWLANVGAQVPRSDPAVVPGSAWPAAADPFRPAGGGPSLPSTTVTIEGVPLHPRWEYAYDPVPESFEALAVVMAKRGTEGWEFAAPVPVPTPAADPRGPQEAKVVLVFKRHRPASSMVGTASTEPAVKPADPAAALRTDTLRADALAAREDVELAAVRLEAAAEQLRAAEEELDVSQKMRDSKTIPQTEYNAVRARAQQMKAQVKEAEIRYAYAKRRMEAAATPPPADPRKPVNRPPQ